MCLLQCIKGFNDRWKGGYACERVILTLATPTHTPNTRRTKNVPQKFGCTRHNQLADVLVGIIPDGIQIVVKLTLHLRTVLGDDEDYE